MTGPLKTVKTVITLRFLFINPRLKSWVTMQNLIIFNCFSGFFKPVLIGQLELNKISF